MITDKQLLIEQMGIPAKVLATCGLAQCSALSTTPAAALVTTASKATYNPQVE
jgi:hypothetical protein